MPEPTLEERFWARVKKGPDCWIWTGPDSGKHGYGKFNRQFAHRLSYEFLIGPIPEGLELDHLCRNPPCVNPAHLEPVTHQENCRRGNVGAWQREKTHCKHGHEFSPENTYVGPNGGRSCRTCRRRLQREFQERRKRKEAS